MATINDIHKQSLILKTTIVPFINDTDATNRPHRQSLPRFLQLNTTSDGPESFSESSFGNFLIVFGYIILTLMVIYALLWLHYMWKRRLNKDAIYEAELKLKVALMKVSEESSIFAKELSNMRQKVDHWEQNKKRKILRRQRRQEAEDKIMSIGINFGEK